MPIIFLIKIKYMHDETQNKQSQQTYLSLVTNSHHQPKTNMSTLANNPSNTFFTQTHLSPQEYTSSNLRKSSHPKDDKPSALSSIPYKNKPQFPTQKQRLISPELDHIINKIQTFVQDIDSKIQNRVQLVKQVYVNEYKEQILEMSAQLKHLREKLDNEVMKERANEKMFYLEEERDFFRHEVIKLNQQMNKLNQENKTFKKMLDQQKRESNNYKQIVYGLQQKILKLKSLNIQRNMLLTSSSKDPLQKTLKNQSSTIDSHKKLSGAKTQRVYKPTKSLETIEDESQREMSRTGYRLRPSQSVNAYPKLSTPNKEQMRSTVTYPKIAVQKLAKIEGYSQLLERQRIVDECINELKRQIYYRNLSIGEREGRVHFGEDVQVKFESFTKTDKKELIIKLLSNEKMLNEFYQYLFNPNLLGNSSRNPEDELGSTTELINQKLDVSSNKGEAAGGVGEIQKKWSLKKLNPTNPKFNSQLLTGLKTEFSKKIFDIKHSHR